MQDRLELFQLDGAEGASLRKAGSFLIGELDSVLDRFYTTALSDNTMASFFADESLIEHARNAQKAHWEKLLTATFEDTYLESTRRIGRVHFRIQLPFRLYLSSYARAASDLQGRLLRKLRWRMIADPEGVRQMLGAVSRAFTLDTELVIDSYFEAQSEEQKIAFTHIEDAVRLLSDGVLTHRIPSPQESDFPMRYDAVRVNFNSAFDELNVLMGTVQEATHQLVPLVAKVGQSVDELSRRTEGQAVTLEETAAAMHEVTESVSTSSQNTKETTEHVDSAKKEVRVGADAMEAAASAMHRIQISSEQITKIIGLIDDIAFQTNLLALNAGVEAARAGESGRGFAVVASEVRSLASSASESAEQIKKLINSSSDEVASGVGLIGRARDKLSSLVSDFERVSDLVATNAAGANEQARSLKEINAAVSDLDMVTQKNAAMVHETTNATRTMHETAEQLGSLVARFTIDAASRQEDSAAFAANRTVQLLNASGAG